MAACSTAALSTPAGGVAPWVAPAREVYERSSRLCGRGAGDDEALGSSSQVPLAIAAKQDSELRVLMRGRGAGARARRLAGFEASGGHWSPQQSSPAHHKRACNTASPSVAQPCATAPARSPGCSG